MSEGTAKRNDQSEADNNVFTMSGTTKNKTSPLNDRVWRCTLYITAGSILVWLFRILSGFEHAVSLWLAALLALATWMCAIRMLLMDSKFKKFWIVWLGLSVILVLISPSVSGMWIGAGAFAFVFLLIRLYKPYRHLTSRHRAALYLIGFIVFCLMTVGWLPLRNNDIRIQSETIPQAQDFMPSSSQPLSFVDLGRDLAGYSVWSLRFFWFFSIFHIFLNIRLYFMKLKPKLAISAVLIAFIPLLLINVMGILTVYSTLGASRATRARAILQDWTRLAVQDENFIDVISDRSFAYVSDGDEVQKEESIPPWFPEFLQMLNTDTSRAEAWKQSNHAKLFWVGPDIWLVRFENVAPPIIGYKRVSPGSCHDEQASQSSSVGCQALLFKPHRYRDFSGCFDTFCTQRRKTIPAGNIWKIFGPTRERRYSKSDQGIDLEEDSVFWDDRC